MSLFSVGTILFLLYQLYVWRRVQEISIDGFILLIVIWFAQLFFAFADGLCTGCGQTNIHVGRDLSMLIMLIVLSIIAYKLLQRAKQLKRAFLPFFGILLVTLLYVEYFNGAETFRSMSEFRSWERPLKAQYHLFPYEVVSNSEGTKQEASLLYLPEMISQLLTTSRIKQENGTLFYYEINGLGESGRWFEYGVSKAKQVQ